MELVRKVRKTRGRWVRLRVCEEGSLMEVVGADGVLPISAALLEGLGERLARIEERLDRVEGEAE
jgi:hypothetical protein